MDKILTVSIAAYNVERYLRETLDSFIVPEVMESIEVIVVDDGSKDNTAKIANDYVEKYPGTFRLIQKENGGWGSTVNTGLSDANGLYFKLLDGDDRMINLAEFIDLLKSADADLVYTNYRSFYEDSDKFEHSVLSETVKLDETQKLKHEYFSKALTMHSCAFKTQKIKNQINITEKCFYTDVEFVLKSIVNIETVLFSDLEVYDYRLGRMGQSVSVDGYRKHYKEHLLIVQGLLSGMEELHDNEAKVIYLNRLQQMVNSQYEIFLLLEGTREHAKELSDFDQLIKNHYPMFYDNSIKRIKLFRLIGPAIYNLVRFKQ